VSGPSDIGALATRLHRRAVGFTSSGWPAARCSPCRPSPC